MENLGERAPVLQSNKKKKKKFILFSCLRQDTKEKYVVDAPVKRK
jgi:hypothetical protein